MNPATITSVLSSAGDHDGHAQDGHGHHSQWLELHDLARDTGLATGLRALQEAIAPAGVPYGPAGHVVLLAGTPCADAGQRCQPEQTGAITLGADVLLIGRRPPGEAVSDEAATRLPDRRSWAIGISWVRLGTSRWLLRHCVAHARDRQVGDGSLLQQQLVIGAVADALIEQLEAQSLLAGGADPDATLLAEVNAAIVTADRLALGLLGASGFQECLPSLTAWASELLADAYIGPPGYGGTP